MSSHGFHGAIARALMSHRRLRCCGAVRALGFAGFIGAVQRVPAWAQRCIAPSAVLPFSHGSGVTGSTGVLPSWGVCSSV